MAMAGKPDTRCVSRRDFWREADVLQWIIHRTRDSVERPQRAFAALRERAHAQGAAAIEPLIAAPRFPSGLFAVVDLEAEKYRLCEAPVFGPPTREEWASPEKMLAGLLARNDRGPWLAAVAKEALENAVSTGRLQQSGKGLFARRAVEAVWASRPPEGKGGNAPKIYRSRGEQEQRQRRIERMAETMRSTSWETVKAMDRPTGVAPQDWLVNGPGEITITKSAEKTRLAKEARVFSEARIVASALDAVERAQQLESVHSWDSASRQARKPQEDSK